MKFISHMLVLLTVGPKYTLAALQAARGEPRWVSTGET